MIQIIMIMKRLHMSLFAEIISVKRLLSIYDFFKQKYLQSTEHC